MKMLLKGLLAAGLFGLASLTIPSALEAQLSGVEIWSQNCGKCHRIQPANRYTADQWETIMMHMMIAARLTDDESDAVLQFLQSGAKRTASSKPAAEPTVIAVLASLDPQMVLRASGGAELYAKQCVACHGKSGEGNGPAAVALDPRPSDLTDPERMNQLTDEQLLEIVAQGRGTMPGFKNVLTPEELQAVSDYIRSLVKKEPK